MKRLLLATLLALVMVLAVAPLDASTIYSATVTITNSAGTTNGQTLTVNADVRTWTNSVIVAQSQILTNATIDGAALNLLLHISAYPFTGLSLTAVGTNAVKLTTALDGTWPDVALSAGWGTVTMVTNTIVSAVVVRMPIEAEPATNQTNVVSWLISALNSGKSTNSLVAPYVSGTLTNDTTGNAATATLASYVSGVLTNNTSGNATMATNATTATNAIYASNAFKLASAAGDATMADLAVTNGIYWQTNAWAGPSNVLNAGISAPVYTAWTPCEITGVTNTLAYQRRPISLLITNASDSNITVYFTGAGRFVGGVKEVVITNLAEHYIQVEAGASTNVNMAEEAHLWK